MKITHKSGTRRKAIARATLKPGKGLFKVNNVFIDNIEPELVRLKMQEPLLIADDVAKKVDIFVRVKGGGVYGQADAVRLAVARTLVEFTGKEELKNKFLEYDRTLLVADVRTRETRKPNTGGNARGKIQKSYR